MSSTRRATSPGLGVWRPWRAEAALDAHSHHGAASFAPVRGQPASSDEQAAWTELDRLQGSGERRAALLALLLTPDERHELACWTTATADVQQAGRIFDLVGRFSLPARPAALDQVAQLSVRAPQPERIELLKQARQLMCADGRVTPIDRLRLLHLRQILLAPEQRPADSRPAALQSVVEDVPMLPPRCRAASARFSAFLARLVPREDPAAKVGAEGARWYHAVVTRLWRSLAPDLVLPDGDQLAQALAELREISWMQRPLLARAWVESALDPWALPTVDEPPEAAVSARPSGPADAPDGDATRPPVDAAGALEPAAPAAGAPRSPPPREPALPGPQALEALRLSCRMIDCPLPPALARHFVEHPNPHLPH